MSLSIQHGTPQTPLGPSALVRAVQLACAPYARLHRANTGLAWTGDVTRLKDGSVLIKNPRPFKAGVVGMADLVGWTLTGRYVALEVKSGSGRATVEQRAFIAAVTRDGGIAGVVRSVEEAVRVVSG